jgi:hypothetical protein
MAAQDRLLHALHPLMTSRLRQILMVTQYRYEMHLWPHSTQIARPSNERHTGRITTDAPLAYEYSQSQSQCQNNFIHLKRAIPKIVTWALEYTVTITTCTYGHTVQIPTRLDGRTIQIAAACTYALVCKCACLHVHASSALPQRIETDEVEGRGKGWVGGEPILGSVGSPPIPTPTPPSHSPSSLCS